MTCETMEPELVAYHFGTVDPEARAAVEDHLVGCAACLRSFVALKRDIETGEAEPAPSKASRDRLRLAVMHELHPSSPARPWRWWERPLAFGLAGAAVFAAFVTVYEVSVGPGAAPWSVSARMRAP